jgi:hypothetical protein
VNIEYVFAVVLRSGMVRGMHAERFAVVVDCDVDWPSQCLFDAFASTSSPGKVVHSEFMQEAEQGCELVAFLLRLSLVVVCMMRYPMVERASD